MKTTPCPRGCSHSDAEHRAFDAGVEAGRQGTEDCYYRDGVLREAWLTGHSVGDLELQRTTKARGSR
mgnify:CR=1 FL=1